MKVKFNMGAQIPGSKSWHKGDVVDSSEIPGGYLASFLRSGIVSAVDELPAPAPAPAE